MLHSLACDSKVLEVEPQLFSTSRFSSIINTTLQVFNGVPDFKKVFFLLQKRFMRNGLGEVSN